MVHHAHLLRLASPAAFCLRPLSTAIDVLHLCAAAQSLSATKQAQALGITHGLLPSSVSIAAALILSYAANHSHPFIPHSIFQNSLPHARSAFLHNTFLRACGLLSHHKTAVHLGISSYNDLLRDPRFRPDDYTFPFALKLCATCSDLHKGLEVHGRLIKAGFDGDVFVNNTLLLFYGSCGDLVSARRVFDEMPVRDSVTWNTCIRVSSDKGSPLESIRLFKDMILSGFVPDVVTIVTILHVCAALEDGNLVGSIHSYVFKVGLCNEIKVGNGLVDAYGKCGDVSTMKRVFDEMNERNDVSWNSIIGGFSCNDCDEDAFGCFRAMVRDQVGVNTVTIATVLPTLLELNMFGKGKEVHGYSVRMGMDSDDFVANALMDMYGKSGRFAQASYLFGKMETKSIVGWNTMIGNVAQNGHELEALDLVREMQAHGETLNSITVTNVLPACARLGFLCNGMEIHAVSIKSCFTSDLFVSNALMDMYVKCGRLDLAEAMFIVSAKDEVSYNILITSYSEMEDCSNSITLFKEMEALGLIHDAVSYMGVISACTRMNAIKEGKQVHAMALRRSFHEHPLVANSLLNFYAKCGQINTAMDIFTRIRIHNKDSAPWNTMILAFGMIGEFSTAIDLFDAMKSDGVEHDSISYIAVLSCCSHGGLVEKGKHYFNRMLAQNVQPPLEMHYACMVDLLGRSGLMQEAVDLIRCIPGEPGAKVWGALLGASRVHGNIEVGCWAAERLLELKPDQPGHYVVLANMYTDLGRRDEAGMVRNLMRQRGLKKNPGCSWVQDHAQPQYSFVAGDMFDLNCGAMSLST